MRIDGFLVIFFVIVVLKFRSLPKEQEAGALAMEALHRQVLPFLLRRVKEDVLDDLPPKITQDYYCELSRLQEKLYEDFAKTHAHQTLQQSICSGATASSMQGNTHIFQALRYLQNVCNHPKLVLNQAHPQYASILAELQQQESRLDDIAHSAKLPALKSVFGFCLKILLMIFFLTDNCCKTAVSE